MSTKATKKAGSARRKRRRSRERGVLGQGEYEPVTGSSEEIGRDLFLATVHRRYPKVLKALRSRPWTAFRAVHQDLAVMKGSSVEKALEQWAQRYHLTAHWCQERALQTMADWLRRKRFGGWVMLGRLRGVPLSDEERRFAFEDAGWDPATETSSDAEVRIRLAVETQLREKLNELDRRMSELTGWRKVPLKRRDRHFGWLARFQVGEEPFDTIAKDEGVDRMAVMRGVKGVAKSIGLPLRH